MPSPLQTPGTNGLSEFGSEKMERGLKEDSQREEANRAERKRLFKAKRNASLKQSPQSVKPKSNPVKAKPRTKRLMKLDSMGRTVSVAAIKLCEEALGRKGYKLQWGRERYLFYFLARILRTTEKGAYIRRESIPDHELATELLKKLSDCGLIWCSNWNSWAKGSENTPEGRRLFPLLKLMSVDVLADPRVRSWDDYKGGRYCRVKISRTGKKVVVRPSAHLKIPKEVIRNLMEGTGIICDRDKLDDVYRALHQRDEHTKVRKLLGLQRAVGDYRQELMPKYKQKKNGRIYSSKPNVQGMPPETRCVLRSIDGLPLYNVDYGQFELRILYILAGKRPPPIKINAFDVLSKEAGIPNDEAKRAIYPILNGRTWGHLKKKYKDSKTSLQIEGCYYFKTKEALKKLGLEEELNRILKEDKYLIQRTGAGIFFRAMSEAIGKFRIKGGIEIHDGWVFSARNKTIAEAVRNIFVRTPLKVLGYKFPVKRVKIVPDLWIETYEDLD